MKIYYDTRKPKLYELQTKAFFTPLMTFLQARPNCTLRELNQHFPEKGFVKYLESCIEVGWIERADRRYQLNLPVYTQENQQQVGKKAAVQELFQDLLQLSQEELAAFLQPFVTCQPEIAYLVADDVALGRLQAAGLSGDLQAFSLVTKPDASDLAGYFVANRHLEEPVIYSQLAQLIGDVDEEYYFQQVQWILSRVGKGKAPKANIFYESLLRTGVLTKENQLTIPYLRNLSETTELKTKMMKLNHFEISVLLGFLCENRFKGLFRWFYKEKTILANKRENN